MILAKNESYYTHNLAMHASKMWALTLNFVWMLSIENNINQGMKVKIPKTIAQSTAQQWQQE